MLFDVALELNEHHVDNELRAGLPTDLPGWHAIVAESDRGWLSVIVLVEADSAVEAAQLVIPRVERLNLKRTVRLDVQARELDSESTHPD